MGNSPRIVERTWSLHSIITMDGTPFAVLQEWAMWHSNQTYQSGAEALAPMPTGAVRLEALSELVGEKNRKEVTEELYEGEL